LGISVGLISVLYIAVNTCYWAVVPQEIMQYKAGAESQTNIAEAFFTLTLGSIAPDDPYLGKRIANALIAVSALGNIIVMAYTATRVKQEIAKEGILPWPRFFAQNYDMSIGRILKRAQANPSINRKFNFIFRSRWFTPSNFQESTPVGAMLLHLATCFLLILATWKTTSGNAYSLITGVSAYLINACFGCLLSAGLLYLRWRPSLKWSEKSKVIHPAVSTVAAILYFILNAFPVCATWIPPSVTAPGALSWLLVPALAWAMLGAGALWWLGFIVLAARRDRKENTVLTIDKVPEYEEDPAGSGLWVQTHETTYICRQGREFAEGDFEAAPGMRSRGGAGGVGSDFDGFGGFGNSAERVTVSRSDFDK
jgi:amino acid transporter